MKIVVSNKEYRDAIRQINDFDKNKDNLSAMGMSVAAEKIQKFFGLNDSGIPNEPKYFEDSSAKKEYESAHIQELNYNLIMNITELCDQRDISFRALEEAVGLSNGSIRKWETVSPSIDKVSQIAEFFDVEISYLTSSYADRKESGVFLDNLLLSGAPLYIKTRTKNVKELNSKERQLILELSKSIDIPSTKEYRVQRGDSLYRIAVAHGVFVDDLKNLNGLNSDNIEEGQIIKIP